MNDLYTRATVLVLKELLTNVKQLLGFNICKTYYCIYCCKIFVTQENNLIPIDFTLYLIHMITALNVFIRFLAGWWNPKWNKKILGRNYLKWIFCSTSDNFPVNKLLHTLPTLLYNTCLSDNHVNCIICSFQKKKNKKKKNRSRVPVCLSFFSNFLTLIRSGTKSPLQVIPSSDIFKRPEPESQSNHLLIVVKIYSTCV